MSNITTTQNFELIQRTAKAYATSDIVPIQFRNISNCIIALTMAKKMEMDPFMLMQNSYIIHGKLGWSSTFIIARINACGKFTRLQFKRAGEGASRSCVAYATDKETGQALESIKVTMEMAKAEGWLGKSGSKWKTMPDLMLQYRAASFFGKAYAADMLFGIPSTEEIIDVGVKNIATNVINNDDVIEAVAKKSPYSNVEALLRADDDGDEEIQIEENST